jgi:3-hydroxyisobutyrate dehydrogenase
MAEERLSDFCRAVSELVVAGPIGRRYDPTPGGLQVKVAFIGLGAMGYPMARNLARAHEVKVWNRTTSVAERHAAEHGTLHARTIEECADAEAIITILPTSRDVDEIVEKISSRMKRGTLWIDATSGDPKASRETACRLAGMGVDFVDAPVSGGPVGAEAGTLTVMAGGSVEAYGKAEAILKSCASKIFHVGPVGTGHAIKAVTNTMMAANMWVAGEAMLSLRRLGIAPKLALDVINGASGRSNASENLLPLRLVDGQWPVLFKLALLDKDARIATDILHDQHLAAPMMALTSHLYTAARRALGEDADYVEVVEHVAKMSGESWRG